MKTNRRDVLAAGVAMTVGSAGAAGTNNPELLGAQQEEALRFDPGRYRGKNYDPVRTEHVMDLVVTCSNPESMGRSEKGPLGMHGKAWPIVGGRFEGRGGLRGSVIPGGADLPVVRPDGVEWINALYRLRVEDGTMIVIHNQGIYVPNKTRLAPVFQVTAGPWDWLTKSLFICTLVEDIPPRWINARGPNENDRLLQVHRVY
ncbi:DUF3237 domain-containing protein [Variovorax sp. HJSM1_2]|uniref:DUF3237 domain-containing protein n=1 Tax=Variovorax sp. HJSM1_2 TaxID=3366263 RepID=UPI003BDAA830